VDLLAGTAGITVVEAVAAHQSILRDTKSLRSVVADLNFAINVATAGTAAGQVTVGLHTNQDRIVLRGMVYVWTEKGLRLPKLGIVVQNGGLKGVDVPFGRTGNGVHRGTPGKSVVQVPELHIDHVGVGQFTDELVQEIRVAILVLQELNWVFAGVSVRVANNQRLGARDHCGIVSRYWANGFATKVWMLLHLPCPLASSG
jgi:hypothetical protein